MPSGISDEEVQKIVCSQCHKPPAPDVLPRGKWHDEIAKMMYLRDKKAQPRGDLSDVQLSPDMAAALRYMEAHAPERLEAPKPWPAVAESPLKFTSYGFSVPDAPNNPSVSNVQLADFDGDGKLDVIGTEMYLGTVFWGHLDPQSTLKVIADIPHPDHVTFTDVDNDGRKDLLVANLGQFLPGDHTDGAVIWMRALGGGKFGGFGPTACRASPTWRQAISTATARPISRSPRSDGARRGTSRSSRTSRRAAARRRSRRTSSIRARARFTSSRSI